MPPRLRAALPLAALALAITVAAEEPPRSPASTSFCLFELPREGDTQRLVNLAIVQYVDVSKEQLRLYFGGGNLGSGHEVRIAVKSHAEALDWLARMQATAHECMHGKGIPPTKP